MRWKFFKEFIAEDWREHGGCWSMMAAIHAVAIIMVASFATYCVVVIALHGMKE